MRIARAVFATRFQIRIPRCVLTVLMKQISSAPLINFSRQGGVSEKKRQYLTGLTPVRSMASLRPTTSLETSVSGHYCSSSNHTGILDLAAWRYDRSFRIGTSPRCVQALGGSPFQLCNADSGWIACGQTFNSPSVAQTVKVRQRAKGE